MLVGKELYLGAWSSSIFSLEFSLFGFVGSIRWKQRKIFIGNCPRQIASRILYTRWSLKFICKRNLLNILWRSLVISFLRNIFTLVNSSPTCWISSFSWCGFVSRQFLFGAFVQTFALSPLFGWLLLDSRVHSGSHFLKILHCVVPRHVLLCLIAFDWWVFLDLLQTAFSVLASIVIVWYHLQTLFESVCFLGQILISIKA